jgi:hypothetical protein
MNKKLNENEKKQIIQKVDLLELKSIEEAVTPNPFAKWIVGAVCGVACGGAACGGWCAGAACGGW